MSEAQDSSLLSFSAAEVLRSAQDWAGQGSLMELAVSSEEDSVLISLKACWEYRLCFSGSSPLGGLEGPYLGVHSKVARAAAAQ